MTYLPVYEAYIRDLEDALVYVQVAALSLDKARRYISDMYDMYEVEDDAKCISDLFFKTDSEYAQTVRFIVLDENEDYRREHSR